MLPQRYTKGIEIAAINEINKELRRMGNGTDQFKLFLNLIKKISLNFFN